MGFSLGPYMIIAIVFMVLGALVAFVLKRKFAKYAEIPSTNGMSGREIAEKMLAENGLHDVQVICTPGQLTDHYNPMNKTVNLSEAVYNGRNAAATAVAAHECGHAVQHAQAYGPLNFRSKMVPLQQVSGTIVNFIIMASFFGGAFLFETFPSSIVGAIILGAFGIMALFSIVTLPVEFDASKRALVWIKSSGMYSSAEYRRAQDALKWAATTYVVAALGSLVTLLYFAMSFLGGDE